MRPLKSDSTYAVEQSVASERHFFEIFQSVEHFPIGVSSDHEFDVGYGERATVRVHIVPPHDAEEKSRGYLAAIRRRRSQSIIKHIRELEKYADSDDLVVWAHKPLSALRELIKELGATPSREGAQPEGNACEVLRIVRDTMLGTGWRRYNEKEVRDCIVSILAPLATNDEVISSDVDRAADAVIDLDLMTIVDVAGSIQV